MDITQKEVERIIKEVKKRKDQTITSFADSANMSVLTVSRIVNGDKTVKYSTCERFAIGVQKDVERIK